MTRKPFLPWILPQNWDTKTRVPSLELHLTKRRYPLRLLKKDDSKALSYYKLGAEQGDEIGQYFAARLCRLVLNDKEQEIKYLRMAADQGHVEALHLLGIFYVDHEGEWIKGEEMA